MRVCFKCYSDLNAVRTQVRSKAMVKVLQFKATVWPKVASESIYEAHKFQDFLEEHPPDSPRWYCKWLKAGWPGYEASQTCAHAVPWHRPCSGYTTGMSSVEHGTFTSLVLSTSGGWGSSAMVAFKRLAGLISKKYDQPYSSTLSFIRCKITFSLIDSAIACLRAPRSVFHAPVRDLNFMDHPLTSSVLRSSFRPNHKA